MPTAAPRSIPSTMTITSYDTQTGYRVRKRLSMREMIMLSVIVFFVLLSIGLLVGLLVRIYVVEEKLDDVCKSADCVRGASLMLQSVDLAINPCDDFYTFACGEYVKKMPIGQEVQTSKEVENIVQLHELLENADFRNNTSAVGKAIQIYKNCLSDGGIEQTIMLQDLKDFLKQFGGWPIAMPKDEWRQKKDDDFAALLGNVMRMGFDTELIDVSLRPDLANSSIIRIALSQPKSATEQLTGSARKRRQAEKPSPLTDEDREEYEKAVTAIAKLLGNNTEEIISADVNDMLQLKMDIMEAASPAESRTNYTKIPKPMSLWELHRFTNPISQEKRFNWKEMLEALFAGVTKISEDTDLLLAMDFDYLKKFPSFYHQHSQRTLINYVMYEGILLSLKSIFDFPHDTLLGEDRWVKCLGMTSDIMPFALTRFFVENQHFSINKSIEEAEDIVNKLQSAFETIVDDNGWLDAETKDGASQKVKDLKKFFGFPPWIMHDLKLNTYYKYVEISSSSLKTYLVTKNRAVLNALQEYRLPSHELRWTIDLMATSTKYEPFSNSLWVPIGLLKPPHFDRYYLAAMNYGSIGSSIARELEHAFDDVGRQFDGNGNLMKWWSDYSQQGYTNRTHCFISQYGHFCKSMGLPTAQTNNSDLICLSGTKTLDENIADNTGVKASFKAYKKWIDDHGTEKRLPGFMDYSPEQIFFISYAQTWCENYPNVKRIEDNHFPGRFRVNGALSNLAEFSETFECSKGLMNREDDRCAIW